MGETRQRRIEDGEPFDDEGTVRYTRTFKEKKQIPRIAEVAVDDGDQRWSRHLRQFWNSLISRHSGYTTVQE